MQDAAAASQSADISTPPDVQDFATALHQTRAGIIADGLRLQGQAEVYKQLESTQGYPTEQGLKADGLRLQGEAQVYQQLQDGPDVFERYASAHPYGNGVSVSSALGYPTEQGLKADGLRLQGEAQVYQQLQDGPDVFERYASAHPFGSGVSSTIVSRPPDVSDAARAVETGSFDQTFVTRPPDVVDAALSVGNESTSTSDGFNWSDWGIGIGMGVGIALLSAPA